MQLGRAALALVVVGLVACQPRGVTTTPAPVVARQNIVTPTSQSLQLILVITSDWDAVPGAMRRYERDGVHGAWRSVGAEVPVVVGASGLGWGDGLHGIGSISLVVDLRLRAASVALVDRDALRAGDRRVQVRR